MTNSQNSRVEVILIKVMSMRSKKEIQGQYVVQLGPRGSYQGEQIKYWHNGLFYFCYLLDSKYESSSTITPYIWISIHQQPYWLQGWIFEIVVHIAYKPRISFLQVCKNELAHCLHELVKYTIKAANGAKLRFCTRRFLSRFSDRMNDVC